MQNNSAYVYPNLFEEKVRLNTFKSWPLENIQPAKHFAASGFAYTGRNDMVRCVFCGGYLHEWDEEDIPFAMHKKFYSDCDFVKYRLGDIPSIDLTKSPYFKSVRYYEKNCDKTVAKVDTVQKTELTKQHIEKPSQNQEAEKNNSDQCIEDVAVNMMYKMGLPKEKVDKVYQKMKVEKKRITTLSLLGAIIE